MSESFIWVNDLSYIYSYVTSDMRMLEGHIGYALGRTCEQYESDQKVDFRLSIIRLGDKRVQKNISFHDGPIASIRLIYNLPLQNKNLIK